MKVSMKEIRKLVKDLAKKNGISTRQAWKAVRVKFPDIKEDK